MKDESFQTQWSCLCGGDLYGLCSQPEVDRLCVSVLCGIMIGTWKFIDYGMEHGLMLPSQVNSYVPACVKAPKRLL